MAKLWRDRVCETTATTGTGTITGAGAVAQYQSLAAFPTGSLVDYTLLSGNGTDWETGEGTVTLSGSPAVRTLSRDIIHESSNSGSAISLTGTSTIYCHMSAKRATQAGHWGPVVSRVPTSANTGLTTWLNQGSATVNDRATGITITNDSSAGDHVRGRTMAVPGATPYSFKALIAGSGNPGDFSQVGIGWYDGTKIHAVEFTMFSSVPGVEVGKWNSVTSFSATDLAKVPCSNPAWMRIRDDGTNASFGLSFSGDDNDFYTLFSVAKASGWLGGSGYTNIVFFVNRPDNIGTLLSLSQGT